MFFTPQRRLHDAMLAQVRCRQLTPQLPRLQADYKCAKPGLKDGSGNPICFIQILHSIKSARRFRCHLSNIAWVKHQPWSGAVQN